MHISREEIHLRDYWEIISKQRNIVLAIFSAVVGLVTIYSFIATPIYEGTASLLVNVEQNPSMTLSRVQAMSRLRRQRSIYKPTSESFKPVHLQIG